MHTSVSAFASASAASDRKTTCGQLVQDMDLLSEGTTPITADVAMTVIEERMMVWSRGNPKERMPEKGTFLCLISKSIPGWHLKTSIKSCTL
jgi:hypothetical protein